MKYDALHVSDLHLGASRHIFSEESYLDRQKKALYQVMDTIKKYKIPYLFITGDIFEYGKPTQNEKDVFAKWLSELDQLGYCKVLVASGNHDEDTADVTALDTFIHFEKQLKNISFITKKVRTFHLKDDVVVCVVPWDKNIIKNCKRVYDALEKKPKKFIVMGHIALPGIKSDTGYPIPGSHSKFLKCDFVDVFLFGDIHKRFISKCGKVQMVGAFIQHKWGDDPKKGYSLLKFNSLNKPDFMETDVPKLIRTTSVKEAVSNKKDMIELVTNEVITEELSDNIQVTNTLDDDDLETYVTNFDVLDGLPEYLKKLGFKGKMIKKSLKFMETIVKKETI